ncbi:MAG: GatB/YqeY domain-containing protein [Clostridia bacterium]|nr:GatB/YqeY domain-containing protein [Clostridia bacterium]
MTIKEQLMEDFKASMKAHDEVAKNTISFARAAIKQYEIDHRGEELDDQGIIAILSKQVKMRKDALADFEKAGRTDLLDSYNAEIAILERYLPKQMTADELRAVVAETAEALGIQKGEGAKMMGKLMGPVMAKVKGLAEGNEVRTLVQEFLN